MAIVCLFLELYDDQCNVKIVYLFFVFLGYFADVFFPFWKRRNAVSSCTDWIRRIATGACHAAIGLYLCCEYMYKAIENTVSFFLSVKWQGWCWFNNLCRHRFSCLVDYAQVWSLLLISQTNQNYLCFGVSWDRFNWIFISYNPDWAHIRDKVSWVWDFA